MKPIRDVRGRQRNDTCGTALAGLACAVAMMVPVSALAQIAPGGLNQDITFQDIYANPDDQDLNLAYARQQADRGELLGAAAALERMLYSNADWDAARLFYAGVLLRLDDVQGVRREVRLLDARPLSVEHRATLDAINARLNGAGAADDATQVAGLSGRVSVSARYDDNAGSVFGDVLFGGNDQPDESVLFQAVLQYTAPVGDSGTTAQFRGEMANRRHEDESDADYDVYGVAAGLRGDAGGVLWSAEAGADFVDIASRDYLDQYGVRGRVGLPVGDALTLSALAGWHHQDYKNLPQNPMGEMRSGSFWEIGPEIDWRPTGSTRLTLAAIYQDKGAETDALAYDGYKLSADARWQVSPDVYLRGSGTYRELNFDGNNAFVFPIGPREDELLRLRGAVGVSANALLPDSRFLSDVTLEFAVNHLDRDTNILGSGFDSTGAEFRLIYDF